MKKTIEPLRNYDKKRVAATVKALKELASELNNLYPERSTLIQQMLLALMTREHVLVYGIYGSGKSDLNQALFSAFTDSTTFSIGLNRYTNNDHVFGAIDIKRMREEGVIYRNPENGILTAEFADLDELFDASDPLLRSLLNLLNERVYKGGKQQETAKLHTAVAATNLEPAEVVKTRKDLPAIIDRFIFQSRVGWLTNAESRVRMLKKSLYGAAPETLISYSDLRYVSDIVVNQNQFELDNDDVLILFERIIQEFREFAHHERAQPISDRYVAKLTQVMEASAILHGRTVPIPEDILTCRYALCLNGDSRFIAAFERIAKPYIDRAMTIKKIANPDTALFDLYDNYLKQIQNVSGDLGGKDANALIWSAKAVEQIIVKVSSTEPKTPRGDERKNEVLAAADNAGKTIVGRLRELTPNIGKGKGEE